MVDSITILVQLACLAILLGALRFVFERRVLTYWQVFTALPIAVYGGQGLVRLCNGTLWQMIGDKPLIFVAQLAALVLIAVVIIASAIQIGRRTFGR